MEADPDVVLHYEDRYNEDARLSKDGFGKLELIRTQLILERHLPQTPASILDVGGGPGAYALWLTELGYEVELLDIIPKHVRRATESGLRAQLGDARALPGGDDAYDAVLLLGPLYHLTERDDRIDAIWESVRVAKPGAPVFVAAISRFAPAIDGLASGFIDDPGFAEIMTNDLQHGKHHNPTGNPDYFTTAFFHKPIDLQAELVEAGLTNVEVLAVEGIGWAAVDLDERMEDDAKRARLLELLKRLETEPSLLGASPHLLAVGYVPEP